MKIIDILKQESKVKNIEVSGWVRTKRGSKNVTFISLNDGSTINNIQVVAEGIDFSEEKLKKITTGSCVKVIGKLVKSKGKEQWAEIVAEKIEIIGLSDSDEYPLQPKKHSLEFLREKAHLRFRTNTFSAVFRLRHALNFAVHKFFNDRGFYNLHTPIITSADAEGAGEMFQVTNLDLENLQKN
jgi:asparaginyl-tRNA synthetase